MDSYGEKDFETKAALKVIRENPSSYIPEGVLIGPYLCSLVVSTALEFGVENIHVDNFYGWWVITGSPDWVGGLEAFRNIIPVVRSYSCQFKPEVLLTGM